VTRGRRDLFDIPRKLYLNDELSDFADLVCEKRNMSFSRFIRLLIEEYMRRCEKELSDKKQVDTSPKKATTQDQPNGLYTAEQVALLITAVRKNER
jgi:hypothetical protein